MRQITVKVRNNVNRKQIILTDDKTIKQAFEEANIEYNDATITVDGIAITATEFNQPLSDFTDAEVVQLNAIVKTANGRKY